MDDVDTMCIETLEINTTEVYLTASDVILKLLSNILENPNDAKYRRIRVSNPNIKSKLFNAIGAKQCLIKIGFIEENDFMTLPHNIALESLHRYKDHLQIRRTLLLSQIEVEDNSNIDKSENKSVSKPAQKNLANATKNINDTPSTSKNVLAINNELRSVCTRNIPAKILHTSNHFLQSIEKHSISALSYEDPILLRRALSHIPLVKLQLQATEKMREIQKAIKTGNCQEKEPLIDDLILLELLAWFKESFFTWVDKAPCDQCGNKDTKFKAAQVSVSERVEVYYCEKCCVTTSFTRHCDPGVLLKTRRGRCGEWANCFTLLCRSLGWSARYVVDDSDHVWTEVYSEGQGRWLHCDPCENACDTPLMYEQGWGKRPKYIIAYGCDDIQDVTWRYTADHEGTLKRRNMCSENELLYCIELLRNERRKNLSKKRQEYLTRRTLMEIVELMSPRKPTDSDKQGRTSGSLSWRLARGETTKEVKKHIWFIDEISSDNDGQKMFSLNYSAARDIYECVDSKGNVLKSLEGWSNGLFDFDKVFRKEEKDWKMVYLARQEEASAGNLVWRFEIRNSNYVIDEVSLKIETDVFENGSISSVMCSGDFCMNIKDDKMVRTYNTFQGQKNFDLTLKLTGGKGAVAWQHAQVFRQKLDSSTSPFQIKITLKKL